MNHVDRTSDPDEQTSSPHSVWQSWEKQTCRQKAKRLETPTQGTPETSLDDPARSIAEPIALEMYGDEVSMLTGSNQLPSPFHTEPLGCPPTEAVNHAILIDIDVDPALSWTRRGMHQDGSVWLEPQPLISRRFSTRGGYPLVLLMIATARGPINSDDDLVVDLFSGPRSDRPYQECNDERLEALASTISAATLDPDCPNLRALFTDHEEGRPYCPQRIHRAVPVLLRWKRFPVGQLPFEVLMRMPPRHRKAALTQPKLVDPRQPDVQHWRYLIPTAASSLP